MLRKFIKDYLTFSRKERIAILLLVTTIGIVFLLPVFTGKNVKKGNTAIDTAWISTLRSLEAKQNDSNSNFYRDYDDNYSNYQFDKRTGQGFKPKG